MTFISYAQNLEDVMLGRVFKDIAKGFYIDIGAHDPLIDSVTKTFYEQGWRGINIEPLVEYYDKLEKDRPEDINLNVAISSQAGVTEFFDLGGLSTLSHEIADQHIKDGHQRKVIRMQTITLSQVCRDCVKGEIHFLKIDVEGAEAQVLTGMDFESYRPWVVVIEATYPNSQKPTYQVWEPLLTQRKYEYVYNDGLNRYYLAKEHADLKPRFEMPPNIFDNYVKFCHLKMEEENAHLLQQIFLCEKIAEEKKVATEKNTVIFKKNAEISFLQKKLNKLCQKNEKLFSEARQKELVLAQKTEVIESLRVLQSELSKITQEKHFFEQIYNDVVHSKSWKVTRPLREFMHLIKQLRKKSIQPDPHILNDQESIANVNLNVKANLSIEEQAKAVMGRTHNTIKKILVNEVLDV